MSGLLFQRTLVPVAAGTTLADESGSSNFCKTFIIRLNRSLQNQSGQEY